MRLHMNSKIKKSFAIILIAITVAGVNAFAETSKADAPKEITGLEWLQLSAADRRDRVMMSLFVLSQHGVELDKSKSAGDYYNEVNEKLITHPDLYSSNLTNILASIVDKK